MTHKTIKVFMNEVYSKGPKQNYITTETDVYFIDNIWSLDMLDLKEYSSENIRGCRYVFVVINNFSKFGWTFLLKNKMAQTKKESFENFLIGSKISLNLIETDRGKQLLYRIFTDFLNKNNKN